MSVVYELFGEALTESGEQKGRFRFAQCPHMAGKQCDGGGNRDMARWPASDQPLAPFFDRSVGQQDGHIPCGVCSVISGRSWAICPRRLLTFDAAEPSPEQRHLLGCVLRLAGFQTGEVNVVSASIDDPDSVHLYSGPITSRQGEACWAELLNTPIMPTADVLNDKLLEENAIAEIHVS